jgi:hypothetical protein
MCDVYNYCWCEEALALNRIDENKLSAIVQATHSEKNLLPEMKKLLQLKNQILSYAEAMMAVSLILVAVL